MLRPGAWEDGSLAAVRELQEVLEKQDIRPWVDIWGTDVSHDWPWWRKQWQYFLEQILGRP